MDDRVQLPVVPLRPYADRGSMHSQITRFTSRQFGLITRQQISEIGLTQDAVTHLVNTNQLTRLSRRVLRLEGAPMNDHVEVMLAVLDASGFASHETGAAIWGVERFSLLPAHVTRRRGGRVKQTHVGEIHETRWLPKDHTTSIRGIPVLRPPRLIFDIAASKDRWRTETALDWLWSRRLVTLGALDQMMHELATPGRPGITMMRELIEARRDQGPFGSNSERRFNYLVAKAGLPEFKRQVDLCDEDGWIGRMDFVSTTHMLIIEIDSELHHAALSDRTRDAARRARLESAGFVVRVVDEKDLFGNTHLLIRKLRQWIREAPLRRT